MTAEGRGWTAIGRTAMKRSEMANTLEQPAPLFDFRTIDKEALCHLNPDNQVIPPAAPRAPGAAACRRSVSSTTCSRKVLFRKRCAKAFKKHSNAIRPGSSAASSCRCSPRTQRSNSIKQGQSNGYAYLHSH